MKKIYYIGILAIIMLFSCSKEQPLTPAPSSQTVEPSMIKIGPCNETVIDVVKSNDDDDSITDPEKEDKEKTNKNAKN